jgi:hypothetical protein
LVGIALLLGCRAYAVEATPAAAIAPDPRIQAAISRVAGAKSEEALAEQMRALVALSGPNYRDLIPQLVVFSMQQHDARDALVPGVLRQRLGITDAQLVEALLPYLSTTDAAQRAQLYNWLGAVDGLTGERRDFRVYAAIISARRSDPPLGLVRYMYESDPSSAATIVAEVYAEPEQRAAQIEARRPVDEVRKTRRAARQPDAAQTATARAVLKTLAMDPAWWTRLYAAAVMVQVPELRDPELVEHLRKDPHPLVREFAAR